MAKISHLKDEGKHQGGGSCFCLGWNTVSPGQHTGLESTSDYEKNIAQSYTIRLRHKLLADHISSSKTQAPLEFGRQSIEPSYHIKFSPAVNT